MLTQLQAELSLDDVEKLMADTAEAIAYQNVNERRNRVFLYVL